MVHRSMLLIFYFMKKMHYFQNFSLKVCQLISCFLTAPKLHLSSKLCDAGLELRKLCF